MKNLILVTAVEPWNESLFTESHKGLSIGVLSDRGQDQMSRLGQLLSPYRGQKAVVLASRHDPELKSAEALSKGLGISEVEKNNKLYYLWSLLSGTMPLDGPEVCDILAQYEQDNDTVIVVNHSRFAYEFSAYFMIKLFGADSDFDEIGFCPTQRYLKTGMAMVIDCQEKVVFFVGVEGVHETELAPKEDYLPSELGKLLAILS